ncbi:MAG TPA: response regulator [Acidobacteriota bacterium]|nr:response regulator [Acidobacteriota bacterium]
MHKKLLVADDSITIQKVVRLTFAGDEITVEAAPDGDLALEKAREIKPDILLADVCMPGRNGYDLCANVKSDPELAHIPVVLIAGAFEPFDESEAKRARCDGRLTKPFDTTELIRVVYTLLGLETPKDDGAEEPKVQDIISQGITGPLQASAAERLVSNRTLESFLGLERILDIFDSDSPVPVPIRSAPAKPEPRKVTAAPELSEETINLIVDRVLRRMSQDVIREVAWEVVPEMSELIIKQCLEEKGKI